MLIVVFCVCYISCSCTGWWRRWWSVFSEAGVIGRTAGLTKTDWDLQGTSDTHTLQLKTLKCDCTWITPERTEILQHIKIQETCTQQYLALKVYQDFTARQRWTKCYAAVLCVRHCCFHFVSNSYITVTLEDKTRRKENKRKSKLDFIHKASVNPPSIPFTWGEL